MLAQLCSLRRALSKWRDSSFGQPRARTLADARAAGTVDSWSVAAAFVLLVPGPCHGERPNLIRPTRLRG